MNKWQEPSELDRVDAHRGNAEWVAGQWREPETRVLNVDETGRCFVNPDRTLRLVKPFGEFDPAEHYLLGTVEDRAVFVSNALSEGETATLREVLVDAAPIDRDLAAAGVGLLNWHRNGRFCPRDGSPTTVIRGGLARQCDLCGQEIFPRSDPAVIVAIVDENDRLLLAHQRIWAEGRVSVLAGFVEVGESFEQAVHREIGEEADVRLGELSYFGSQPWPFPQSIMIGFIARASSESIAVDGEEIEWANWYTRDELTRAVESGELILPGKASIAHRLIMAWWQTDGEIPENW
ncbi:NAD(+) diphosphatase [Naumannella halotolerans]|uniref:NAD(+) diphosphatase n=1 Tax=Naumannella halotolerans TaxID=993414 RepID=A0A4R7J8R5_9ACTN|nr:NAD(+) diphosphatase [Naumannella halotolerans]TDT33705.1 NAD+ diphosphatase [Naumannella halotolerans]